MAEIAVLHISQTLIEALFILRKAYRSSISSPGPNTVSDNVQRDGLRLMQKHTVRN